MFSVNVNSQKGDQDEHSNSTKIKRNLALT